MSTFGAGAVDKLVDLYPLCHHNFGDFQTVQHFAVTLEGPEYVIAEHAHHWVICEVLPDMTGNVHWFCPDGCDIKILRLMIAGLFAGGLTQLQGTPPKGKRYERAARALNRALGAEKDGALYVLTKQRFVKYSRAQNPA